MKPHLRKKELVAMFMESPLYFDLRVRDRLALLKDHIRRFAFRTSQSAPVLPGQVEPTIALATGTEAAAACQSAGVIVGNFPPPKIPEGT